MAKPLPYSMKAGVSGGLGATLAGLALASMVLLAAAVLTTLSGTAEAGCACRCVDGKARPICSSATDIPPLCNNTRCPLSPPKPSPTDVTKPKPPVKPGCKVQQVYNPQTGKHEWGQLCH